jgi:hypothetical protein
LPAFGEWWLKVSLDKLKAEVISLREKKSFLSGECLLPNDFCLQMRPDAT